tara:strand:- start:217 stop:435 length:219 start_codon:yes stop_codon:yes gene_type:complete
MFWENEMALTICKECGEEISTSANTCPHCGSTKVNLDWTDDLGCVGTIGATIVILAIIFGAIYIAGRIMYPR